MLDWVHIPLTAIQRTLLNTSFDLAHFNFQKGLNVHAFFKLSSRERGEDLVQDTFLKTWKFLNSGGEILFIKSYLYRVLNNLIIDEYRKKKTESLDNLIEKNFDFQSHFNRDNKNSCNNVFDGNLAMQMIRSLPQPYKKVMNMKFMDELSNQEIAIKTGQSVKTASMQTYRGLEKLKKLYFKNEEV